MSEVVEWCHRTAETLEHWFHEFRFLLLMSGLIAAYWFLLLPVVQTGEFKYVLQDLLINYADGIVRRGLIGELIVGLSRLFGGAPGYWAAFVGCALAAFLFFLSMRIYRRLPDDPAYLPLILAPWGVLFYAYDPAGSFRKEILGFISVALVLQGGLTGNAGRAKVWVGAGFAIYLTGLFAHEALLFLGPVLAMAYWLVKARHSFGMWPIVVVAVLAVFFSALIAQFPNRDIDVICSAAKLAACHGPFGHLNDSITQGAKYVFDRREAENALVYALQALLCFVPFLGVRARGVSGSLRFGLLVLPLVSVAPLFVLGYDWGRWIQMAFLPLGLIACTAVVLGAAEFRRILPAPLALLYIASWSISHAHGDLLFFALCLWPVLFGFVLLGKPLRYLHQSWFQKNLPN